MVPPKVSVSDASATSSGGTFMPQFGAVGAPQNQTTTLVLVAAALLGLLIWKRF